jgi:hypothetical protein
VARMESATEGRSPLLTVVEAQRRTGVRGPDLMRAVVEGEIPSVAGPYGLELVDLAHVEAWSARQGS